MDEDVDSAQNQPSPLSDSVLARSLKAHVMSKITGRRRFQRTYDPLGLTYIHSFPEADFMSNLWRWVYDEENESLEPDVCLDAQ